MKIGAFISIFAILLMPSFAVGQVLGQDLCVARTGQICQESWEDYHRPFHETVKRAFSASLGGSHMKRLICKNFVLTEDSLRANFAFDRNCWSFRGFRNVIQSNNVHSCEDFKKFGADENFLLNCKDLINKELEKSVSSYASYRLRNIVEYLKMGIKNSFSGDPRQPVVIRALGAILNENNVYRNLSLLETELIAARDFCRESHDRNLCGLYANSDKKILSVGGYVFLSPEVLRAAALKAVAEHVGVYLHSYYLQERALVYMKFLFEKLDRNEFEYIIARNVSEDPLNLSTNTYLVMNKLLDYIKNQDPDFHKTNAKYFCYADNKREFSNRNHVTRDNYYQSLFDELHPFDKLGVMICPFN